MKITPYLVIVLIGLLWYILVYVIHDPKLKVRKDFKELYSSKDSQEVRIMVVLPHPDDECMALGGILRKAAAQGYPTYSLCLTRGEAGQSGIRQVQDLGSVREKEFYQSCSELKVSKSACLNFPDGDLSNYLREITNEIKKEILDFTPSIIFTYDPTGMDGHPDHIATSEAVKIAISYFRNQKRNDGNNYYPQLFYLVEQANLVRKYFAMNQETVVNMPKPTFAFDVRGTWLDRWRAVKCHKTQFYSIKNVYIIPSWLIFLIQYKDYFAEASTLDE